MNKQDNNCVSQLPDNLKKCLENIAKTENILTKDITAFRLSTGGGNYLGELYEVNIKGKAPSGEETLSLFLKKCLPSESISHLSITELYSKEIFIYNELGAVFIDLQNGANIPNEERFNIAKSYECSEDAIILENLAQQGFVTLNRMENISLEFAEMAIQQLARYHALSFIIEKKMPDYFNEKIKTIKHPLKFNADLNKILSIDDEIIDYLDDNLKLKVKVFFRRLKEVCRKVLEDVTHKHVLCHGDYRPNNILTKIVNGQICEMIPVDYQIIFYGSPLIDFFFFIFTSTDRKFRKDHMVHLKEMYYGTMKGFVARFGMDVEEFFSRDEFERSYNDFLEFGLAAAFIMIPFLFAREDSIPELGTEWCYKLNDRYKDRILGVVLDFDEWGLL